MMSPKDFYQLTLADARDGLRGGKFSATKLTEAAFEAIEKSDHLYAFITEDDDLKGEQPALKQHALKQAEESDKRLKEGRGRALEGIPLGVKDLFCTKGIRTTAASEMLRNFIPPYESHVTQQLWDAGAVCAGKLNMDEFAMGSKSIYGLARPPFKPDSVRKHVASPWEIKGKERKAGEEKEECQVSAGGSSGGASAAVSAQICLGAVASDTGGSIRQPAAWTGTLGIKPTYGRCSRYGMIAFASSLDQAGVITKNVRDAAILLKEIAGYDPKDSTSAKKPVPNYEDVLKKDLKGMKVGVIKDFEKIKTAFDPREEKGEGVKPSESMMAVWEKSKRWLKDAGAEIVDVHLPSLCHALPAYYVIAPAEASSNLARYDGVRYGYREKESSEVDDMYEKSRARFGNEVKRRILIGTYVLSAGYYDAYYLKALKVRALISQEFQKSFEKVDLLLGPTTRSSTEDFVRRVGQAKLGIQILYDYMDDIMTVPANLAGLPAASVPVGLDEKNLPLGMQLIAPPFEEARLFQAAQVIEKEAGTFTPPKRWWEGMPRI